MAEKGKFSIPTLAELRAAKAARRAARAKKKEKDPPCPPPFRRREPSLPPNERKKPVPLRASSQPPSQSTQPSSQPIVIRKKANHVSRWGGLNTKQKILIIEEVGSKSPAQSIPGVKKLQNSLKKTQSAFKKPQPPFKKTQSTFKKTQPAFKKTQPAFMKTQSDLKKTQPAFKKTQPAFEKTKPAFMKTHPAFKNTQPTLKKLALKSPQPKGSSPPPEKKKAKVPSTETPVKRSLSRPKPPPSHERSSSRPARPPPKPLGPRPFVPKHAVSVPSTPVRPRPPRRRPASPSRPRPPSPSPRPRPSSPVRPRPLKPKPTRESRPLLKHGMHSRAQSRPSRPLQKKSTRHSRAESRPARPPPLPRSTQTARPARQLSPSSEDDQIQIESLNVQKTEKPGTLSISAETSPAVSPVVPNRRPRPPAPQEKKWTPRLRPTERKSRTTQTFKPSPKDRKARKGVLAMAQLLEMTVVRRSDVDSFNNKVEEDSEETGWAVAMYDCKSEEYTTGRFSFKKGDLIQILDSNEDPSWWMAKLNGKVGWIPSSYVRWAKPSECPPSPTPYKGSPNARRAGRSPPSETQSKGKGWGIFKKRDREGQSPSRNRKKNLQASSPTLVKVKNNRRNDSGTSLPNVQQLKIGSESSMPSVERRDSLARDEVRDLDFGKLMCRLKGREPYQKQGIELREVKRRLHVFSKPHKDVFSGADFIDWILFHHYALTREGAIIIGQLLINFHFITCVHKRHKLQPFADLSRRYYKFADNEEAARSDMKSKQGSTVIQIDFKSPSSHRRKQLERFERRRRAHNKRNSQDSGASRGSTLVAGLRNFKQKTIKKLTGFFAGKRPDEDTLFQKGILKEKRGLTLPKQKPPEPKFGVKTKRKPQGESQSDSNAKVAPLPDARACRESVLREMFGKGPRTNSLVRQGKLRNVREPLSKPPVRAPPKNPNRRLSLNKPPVLPAKKASEVARPTPPPKIKEKPAKSAKLSGNLDSRGGKSKPRRAPPPIPRRAKASASMTLAKQEVESIQVKVHNRARSSVPNKTPAEENECTNDETISAWGLMRQDETEIVNDKPKVVSSNGGSYQPLKDITAGADTISNWGLLHSSPKEEFKGESELGDHKGSGEDTISNWGLERSSGREEFAKDFGKGSNKSDTISNWGLERNSMGSPTETEEKNASSGINSKSKSSTLVDIDEEIQKKWKYNKLKELGRGAFGCVFLAHNLTLGQLMAVKRVDLRKGITPEVARELENEVNVMKKLQNPHIVKMMGCIVVPPNRMEIFMEYVDGNSLDSQLKVFGPFPELIVKFYTMQIVQALQYCHALGVIHRDIKGKNILVMGKGTIKLADFGSAKLTDGILERDAEGGFELDDSFKFTPQWVAPEVLSGRWDEKVDVWSLGCVVLEMASARAPWHEKGLTNTFQIMYQISQTNEIPAISDLLSHGGKDFCLRCFSRDPRGRPPAKDLLTDSWILEMLKTDRLIEARQVAQELNTIVKGLKLCGIKCDQAQNLELAYATAAK